MKNGAQRQSGLEERVESAADEPPPGSGRVDECNRCLSPTSLTTTTTTTAICVRYCYTVLATHGPVGSGFRTGPEAGFRPSAETVVLHSSSSTPHTGIRYRRVLSANVHIFFLINNCLNHKIAQFRNISCHVSDKKF